MSGEYDGTLKYLIEKHPGDWLPLAGRSTSAPVVVVNTDLSTVAAAADTVLRVDEPFPWLLHVELQSSSATGLADRLQWYNTLLRHSHHLPVRTLLVLLHRRAQSPQLDGVFHDRLPDEEPYLTFRYQVVRIWERPVEEFLNGGTGILPLAFLADVPEADLPAVVRQMDQRLSTVAEEEAKTLRFAAGILAGLRLSRDEVTILFQEVFRMKESSTYQIILDEGRVEGRMEGRVEGRMEGRAEGRMEGRAEGRLEHAHSAVLRLGHKRFGAAAPEIVASLTGIHDLDRLDRILERIVEAVGWDDLLQTP